MNPLQWIQALLGKGIVEPVATYFTRKQELAAAKFEAQLKAEQAAGDRRAQLIREGLAADANWEMEFARQAGSTWKDEFELIVISIALIGCFIPKLAPHILTGFAILEKCPHWFTFLVVTIYLANYGIRYWRRTVRSEA